MHMGSPDEYGFREPARRHPPSRRTRLALALVWSAVWALAGAGFAGEPPSSCTGDCNADRRVTIDELVRGVTTALGGEIDCEAIDRNRDQQVTVDELVHAVGFALRGCPATVCGDGVREGDEECDDANLTDGDCCSARCEIEPGEQSCDDGNPCTRDSCTATGTCQSDWTCGWAFEDATAAAGLSIAHRYEDDPLNLERELAMTSGGIAAGDYDGDGWIDLYAVGGPDDRNHLLHNRGDGTFEDEAETAGVGLAGSFGAAPMFVDYDGDGNLDLLVGGVNGARVVVFRNRGDGSFFDDTLGSGLEIAEPTLGFAFGDYDRDGDLDACTAHWSVSLSNAPRLWRQDDDGFVRIDAEAGVAERRGEAPVDLSFAPNFADIDDDGWPDLLIAADFGSSQVFRNQRDGTFTDITTATIDDENGMGAAVGDYDNDGDLDWFVTSIWNPPGSPVANWGETGNRLYRNRGDGIFDDVTDEAGVRIGYWGWGSCFADFDLDGHLDLFHVNGWGADLAGAFFEDPSRLFVANGDGTFSERSAELGLNEIDQGRGVACFDYDRDGDVDIFVANNNGPYRLWRNRAEVLGRSYLTIRLAGSRRNSQAIGARVTVTSGALAQVREIRAGNNFVSQDPALAHFGLAAATTVDEIRVRWPDGSETSLADAAANQLLLIRHPQAGE